MPGYPKGYKGPKPIKEQIGMVAELFGLNPAKAFRYADIRPKLPQGAEGWFAIPRISAVRDKHFPGVTDPEAQNYWAINFMMEIFNERIKGFADANEYSSPLYKDEWEDEDYVPNHDEATSGSYRKRFKGFRKIAAAQDQSEILLVPAQFGLRRRGQNLWDTEDIPENEFPLGLFATSVMLFTNQERIYGYTDLWVSTSGDHMSDEYHFEFDSCLKVARPESSDRNGWVTGFLV